MVSPLPYFFTPAPDWRIPLVVSAPHAGTAIPKGFLMPGGARGQAIAAMSDTRVDKLAAPAAAHLGFPILASRYLRAFIDLNRGVDELDPELIDDVPPSHAHGRVAAGLGLVPRLAGPNIPVYDSKLSRHAVESRIRRVHQPYHSKLRELVNQCLDRFGTCTLIDLHSMPPVPPAAARRAMALTKGQPNMRMRRFAGAPLNFVLGDAFGQAADPGRAAALLAYLQAQGLSVSHNRPYAGGYITAHYGKPKQGVDAFQFEICRSLYLEPANPALVKDLERALLKTFAFLGEQPLELRVAAE